MKLKLSHPERMLFALVKRALTGQELDCSLFEKATKKDWYQCYNLALVQGVRAIAWDGVLTLPVELQPERNLKFSWLACVDKVERQHAYYCSVASKLKEFYLSHGVAMFQLKGVGLSADYPIPEHREGGDIDIYTYSNNRDSLSDDAANRLADKLMEDQGIKVDYDLTEKHSIFCYENVLIENHKTFLNVEKIKVAQKVEAILKENQEPREVSLCNDRYRINVPSPTFNMLFVSFHAAQHYLSGLALHHLCDWAVLINKYGFNIPESIDGGYRAFLNSMTALCNELLGSSIEGVEIDELAKELLVTMLYPKYGQELPNSSKLGILLFKTKRFFYRNIKRKRVLGVSLMEAICQSIVSHIKRPYTIFH